MAKMHSRARGHAKSHKPLNPQMPTWVRFKEKEVELLVGKIAKEGKSASEIGMILRDSYGIPSVKLLTGKRVQEILGEKKMLSELPEDLLGLIRRSIHIRKHLEINKHDMAAKRGLLFTESKINRLVKYYKKTGKVALTWKYDPEAVKVYAQ